MQREDHLKLNFEDLEMEKWNILIDRAQISNEKIAYLSSIIFTPGVIAIEIRKMALFLCFLMRTVKNLVTALQLKVLIEFFQKMLGIVRLSC